ncbi:DUF2946 family protein [Acidovorax sp. SUPP3334]|uniref:DUF2946 family protein n=1 Tax=Acidovorax sp. SUPP3334 TaxID=2920881 RepID=UPI0023DE4645|nr:DUF2946 family protein [Acidovorax sp. SUPP3334]GKT26817.1 DUF2946 domain-containing protein [Acidovorax sp. SUPP3334]
MHTLRHARLLARLILVWFVASLGMAVAAPLVHPQRMEPVCSASGETRWVMVGATDGAAPSMHHGLECPLCLPSALPPSSVSAGLCAPSPQPSIPVPLYRAPLAETTGAPFPPRAPPLVA